ncbi:non-canonical purine NTP pyrophosphatase [Glycomyces rhizosphaerae]|uniref:Non-canonical purine NTP pyrophosphatase n=1 Tax=Glycomyces rhizosphaerae TaxID=2054422 RepID=A0ABV7Q584_9ACTN
MSGDVRIATGNAGKVALLGGYLTAAGFQPRMADPGDAEDRAETGYRPAVLAKLAGVPEAGPPVVAHDSGFEFACLGGEPGPRTKAWLASTDDVRRELVPGTGVRVVHCVGLRFGSQTLTFLDHDDRIVPEQFLPEDSDLPLTNCFVGPRDSLARLMGRVAARLAERTTADFE